MDPRPQRDEHLLADAARLIGVPAPDLLDGVQRKIDEIKSLNDEIKTLRAKAATGQASELAAAATRGKGYATAFISTWTMMARITDVVITSYSSGNGSDGGGEMTTLELNFKSIKYEPVR